MSNFGSFSYFQTSLSLGVEQVLQKQPKFDINDLKLLFYCYILIPRKCPRKTPFKTRGGGAPAITVPTVLSVVAMKTFAPLKIADDPTRPDVWGPGSKCRHVNFFKVFFFQLLCVDFDIILHSFIAKFFFYAEGNCFQEPKVE